MLPRIKYLAIIFVLFLLVFATQKPVFMLYNHEFAEGLGLGDYFMVMLHGLKLDITVACYAMVLPWLVVIVSQFVRIPVRKILLPYYILLLSVVAIIFVADCTMYYFWKFKLNSSVFMYTDRPADALASVSTGFVIVRFLWIIGCAVLYGWVFSLIRNVECEIRNWRGTITSVKKTSWVKKFLIPNSAFLIIGGLLFLGIRGGVDESTANISDVYYSDNQFLNHSAVNPTFNMLYTLTKSEDFSKEFAFFSDEEREPMFSQYYNTQSVDTDTLLYIERPNVLLVIWEGCPAAFVGATGGEADVTPNLNRMAEEGIVFTNCYANSYRTDRGVLCTLSGWLGMPTASLMKMTDKSSTLPGIAASLRSEGYATDFWYGGDVGFTNMNSYLYETGYQRVVGDTYFSAKDRNYSKWGVPDHVVADTVAANILRRPADSRWMTTFLTLSSHEPWEVPYDRLSEKKRNSMAYTDDCLGKLIGRLKESSVWDNLLVVILSDHGIRLVDGQPHSDYRMAHIPMVWTGGAIKNHRTVSTLVAQSDMAATLLGQLRIPHDDFIFSRDVFSSTYTSPSAFHTFSNGMTLIDSTGVVTFDNEAQRVVLSESFTSTPIDADSQTQKAKAIVQTVYKDAAVR